VKGREFIAGLGSATTLMMPGNACAQQRERKALVGRMSPVGRCC